MLRELYQQRNNLTSQIAALEVEVAKVDEKILAATREVVLQMYALSGKQSGTVTVAGEDGVVIKGDVSKTVKWDSAVLMRAAKALPWDTVQSVFDIAFKVPEKTFTKLTTLGLEPEVVALIEEARTTKYGDLKVTLEVKE